MSAMGRTPMGNAFGVAQAMVEDRSIIASRDYHPTIILVSDGIPTDEWIPPLNNLITSERASKALRLSMAIGAEADNEPLQSFYKINILKFQYLELMKPIKLNSFSALSP